MVERKSSNSSAGSNEKTNLIIQNIKTKKMKHTASTSSSDNSHKHKRSKSNKSKNKKNLVEKHIKRI
eukprot:UN10013